ncbi:MAG: hypothetical protein ACC707_03495 [Thiohalomonadales bacterium]
MTNRSTKNLLIYVLLLTTLFSGVAFAWDTDPEAMVGHDQAKIDLLTGDDHNHPEGTTHHNDHCCHGIAHLVGIITQSDLHFFTNNNSKIVNLDSAITSHYLTPFLRPPIS